MGISNLSIHKTGPRVRIPFSSPVIPPVIRHYRFILRFGDSLATAQGDGRASDGVTHPAEVLGAVERLALVAVGGRLHGALDCPQTYSVVTSNRAA